MKKYLLQITLFSMLLFLLNACSKADYDELSRSYDSTAAFDLSSSSIAGSASGEAVDPNGTTIPPGQLTAGEWNDLIEWDFLKELLEGESYSEMEAYWTFFPHNRFSVEVQDFYNRPIPDVDLRLLDATGEVVWQAKTDNEGRAELWHKFYSGGNAEAVHIAGNYNGMNFSVNTPQPYSQGVNQVQLPLLSITPSPNVDLAFVVDATGSMGDEIEYLKSELLDVIQQVRNSNPSLNIRTGSVFYRDQGDEYVTRTSEFTTNTETTMDFIGNQRAGGGGDFPEAVHTAVEQGLGLDWSEDAITRIMFLVLDAPPHYEEGVISELQDYIQKAAEQGIKVIPVTASGIDKNTEFLMRFFSMGTNGTYVFITDHSGIGNDHLEPTIGDYEVEFLNELMIRLIKKYTEY